MSGFRNLAGGPVCPVWDYANGKKTTLAGSSATPAVPEGTTYVLLCNNHGSNTFYFRADGVAAASATEGNIPLLPGEKMEVAIPTGGAVKAIGTGDLYTIPLKLS